MRSDSVLGLRETRLEETMIHMDPDPIAEQAIETLTKLGFTRKEVARALGFKLADDEPMRRLRQRVQRSLSPHRSAQLERIIEIGELISHGCNGDVDDMRTWMWRKDLDGLAPNTPRQLLVSQGPTAIETLYELFKREVGN